MEQFNMGCKAIQNDYGITVIDVTQPDSVRYCFVHFEDQVKNGENRPESEEDEEDGGHGVETRLVKGMLLHLCILR